MPIPPPPEDEDGSESSRIFQDPVEPRHDLAHSYSYPPTHYTYNPDGKSEAHSAA